MQSNHHLSISFVPVSLKCLSANQICGVNSVKGGLIPLLISHDYDNTIYFRFTHPLQWHFSCDYWRLQGIVQLVKFSEFIVNRGYYWVWRILLSSGRGCKKYFSVKYIFLVHVFSTDIYDHNVLIKSETYGFRLGSHQARSTEKGQLFYILHAFLIFYVPQFEFRNEKQLLV